MSQGAYVTVNKGTGGMTIISTSAPMPWPGGTEKETWQIQTNPGGEGTVFVSSKGRLLWRTPSEEGGSDLRRQSPTGGGRG